MDGLSRIRTVSRIVRRLAWLPIVGIPAFLALFWATAGPGGPGGVDWWSAITNSGSPLPAGFDPATMTPALRLLAFLASMITAGLVVYAFWQIRLLFGLYERGAIFTEDNARILKRIAWAVVVTAPASVLKGSAMSVLLSWNNGPGQRELAVSLGTGELFALFAGVILLVISWVMGQAQAVWEENRQFV